MIQRILWFLKAVWRIQKNKYQRRGLVNNLIAFFLFFCMFYFIPSLCKPYWPEHIDDLYWFQLKWQWGLIFSTSILYILLFLPGYLGAKVYKKYEISNVQKLWERPDWPEVKWNMVKYYIINNGILFPLFITFGIKVLGVNMETKGFPSNWEIFRTIMCLLFIDDFIYMVTHRLFHEVPSLYKYHKVHHTVQANFSLLGNYNHPVDHYLGAIIPASFGFSFIHPHIFIAFFWYAFKLLNSSQGHSGYDFPWDPLRILPFIYGNSYHQFHHRINEGNFATSLYLVELFLGTNDVFFKEQFKKYGQEWVSPPQFWEETKKVQAQGKSEIPQAA